jgi:uncharacterized protein involved in exopolysaccharide biosynthesis
MKKRLTITTDNSSHAASDTSAGPQASLFDLSRLLLRRRQWILTSVVVVMVVTALVSLLISNRFISTAAILPSGQADQMADLKSLAGFGISAGQDENSSVLFPSILSSRLIGEELLGTNYVFTHRGNTLSVGLSDYFGEEDPDKLYAALSEICTVTSDKKTGVITLGVETTYPGLSQAILTEQLAELEEFNLHKRRSAAKDKADYLARQVVSCQVELTFAEDSLSAFQGSNRDWVTSYEPEVAKLLARLKRDVDVKNQTYLFLSRELEIAKLDAQKDIPIIRILDAPSLPTVKSGPRRSLIVIVAGLLSLIMAVLWVCMVEYVKKGNDGPKGEELRALRTELRAAYPRLSKVVDRKEEMVSS